MGSLESYDDLGPGLHVLREAEPLKRAGSMAASLRADLCATLPQAEAALSERSELPLVDTTTLGAMEVLAKRIARAERIATRTRERTVIDLGQRLAGTGSGLAVHPTTIRDRAAAVDAARAGLQYAEQALAEHAKAADETLAQQAEEQARQAEREAADGADADDAETHGTPLRARRTRSIGAIVTAFGLALVLLALAVPLWAALLPPFAASLWALWYLRPASGASEADDDDPEGRAEASQLLAQISAAADGAFGPDPVERALGERRTLLEARRDRAIEELRVAQRAWHELAGEDVDIDELEEVVRRYDPQHEDARLLADETAGVRTAEAVLHRFQQRWTAFWRELGAEAPAPEAGEDAVRDLAARVSRPIVLVGPATECAAALARVAPAAPVVVLDGPDALT